MFGMAASGSKPYAAGPWALVGIPAEIDATVTITFGGSPETGLRSPIAATARITFGGQPVWSALQEIHATVSFAFGGEGLLVAGGRPLIVTAVPESFVVLAVNQELAATAVPYDFTVRGVAH